LRKPRHRAQTKKKKNDEEQQSEKRVKQKSVQWGVIVPKIRGTTGQKRRHPNPSDLGSRQVRELHQKKGSEVL